MMLTKTLKHFDAVVVGAGPAGITAALTLARAGLEVALFERGETPGAKNLFGGVLHHCPALSELLPGFWNEAPVERIVTKYVTSILSKNASCTISYQNEDFADPASYAFTILRSKFDRWYAEKAEESGVVLVTDTLVEDIVREKGRVVGIKTARPDGILYADVVIAADGVNSLLAKQAGLLLDENSSMDVSVAAKEILALPMRTIESRFSLRENEGLAHLFIGESTRGIEGGGFLYTNKESLSLGVVAKLNALQENKISIADLLEDFKEQAAIKELIKDSVIREYSGHMIPEGGLKRVPKMYGDGILVVGDAASLVSSTGLTLQGMDLAMQSGFFAAKTVIQARIRGDFSSTTLSEYSRMLEESFVLKDLRTFRHFPSLLSNPRLYNQYPAIICDTAKKFYRPNGIPRKKLLALIAEEMKGKVSRLQAIKDFIALARAIVCL